MARKNYPENVYLSPCFAIRRFMGLRAKHGDLAAVTDTKYKPEREMWIAAVFLLGISQSTHKDYWLRPNNEDTAPDVFAISLLDSKTGVRAEVQRIEIFEYEKHSQTDLVTAIKEKLDGKAYADDVLLLCYIHSRPQNESIRPIDIFKAVKKFNPKIAQIWILTSIVDSTGADHATIQVFPNAFADKFSHIEKCKNSRQADMIHAKRDLTKFVTKVEFEPMGNYILKLP